MPSENCKKFKRSDSRGKNSSYRGGPNNREGSNYVKTKLGLGFKTPPDIEWVKRKSFRNLKSDEADSGHAKSPKIRRATDQAIQSKRIAQKPY